MSDNHSGCPYNALDIGWCSGPIDCPVHVFEDGVGSRWTEPLPKLNVSLMEECWRFAAGQIAPRAVITMELVDLLNAKVEQVEHEVHLDWNQDTWELTFLGAKQECGTAFCIAGYAAFTTGNTTTQKRVGTFTTVATNLKDIVVTQTGPCRPEGDWSLAGQELLGLTPIEAHYLFAGDNELEAIHSYMCDIAKSRGVDLELDY